MMFWNRLYKKGLKTLRGFLETFGQKTTATSQEIREEIIHRLESVYTSTGDPKLFPFKKIAIRLQPPTRRAAKEFNFDLVKDDSLKSDIYKLLKHNQVQFFDLEISVDLLENSYPVGKDKASASSFEMEFLEPIVFTRPEIPELRLEILKGTAEQPVYQITKDRLLVGCLPEVHDLEGRLVRKNNVVFPHEGNETNATVGTMHARIWFDFKKQEFRVMDESSRYGTRIVRGGRTIEVPPENPNGVGLRSGDEVHFGQACFRFMVVNKVD
jgi:hypothetical protein